MNAMVRFGRSAARVAVWSLVALFPFAVFVAGLRIAGTDGELLWESPLVVAASGDGCGGGTIRR